MQGNQASSRCEGVVSLFYSSCSGNLRYILELRQGWYFQAYICSAMSGLQFGYERHLCNLFEAWQGNTDASQYEAGNPWTLSSFHSDIGILSIFKKGQESTPFETLNSRCLLKCQRMWGLLSRWGRDLRFIYGLHRWFRHPFILWDVRWACIQATAGNLAFFQVRASQCLFHLMQKTQGPTHMPIAEGSLLLRCFWKVGIPLQLKPGNQLSFWDDLACTKLSSSCWAEIGFHVYWRRVSQGISGVA